MIYLTDFYYRVLYLFSSLLISLIYLYINLEEFIFIFIIPSILQTITLDAFIFTEPKEIFFFKINICIFFLFLVSLPYLIILICDYFKAALYKTEWKKILNLQILVYIYYYCFTIISFFLCIPIFWKFFLSLSQKTNLINYFFELSALNYFNFVISTYFLIFSSLIFIFFIFICLKFLGLISILKIKNYIILCFLIFSTIITPPDLEFQILLFFSLYICLEFFFFLIYLIYYYLNFKKVTN